MPTVAENIASAIAGYAQQLADDSLSPKVDYSIDGQSVSRSSWRAEIGRLMDELLELQQKVDPFEQRTYAI